MEKGTTTLNGPDSAVASAMESRDIELCIRDEISALRCAHGAMSESENSGTNEMLSYATSLMNRAIDRLDQLQTALEDWEMRAAWARDISREGDRVKRSRLKGAP